MAFVRLIKLQQLPYDYRVSTSIKQAKQILTSERFDVIIADYSLSDGTAFNVMDLAKDTPIVFTTGAGNEEIAVNAMKAGAYDYLIKDIQSNYLKVLPQVVRKAIMHKRTEDALSNYRNNLEALVEQRTEQLIEEKELLNVTLLSMTDGLIAVDTKKQIVLFNRVAENLTKWKFEEVHGKSADEVLHLIDEKTRRSIQSPIDEVLSSGTKQTGTDRDVITAKDGSQCPISITAAPIHRNDGSIIGVVMLLRDVSREREIDRMKTDFVSSVSHELRTPLSSIKAHIATILRDPNMSEQTRHQFLSIINEEADRLKDLIEGLLEISRVESGAVEIVRKSVCINDLINKVMDVIKPLADKKNIQLHAYLHDGLGRITVDECKITSMLINLLTNAIKFTPELGCASISTLLRDKQLFISVSDTGVGIPKHALPRIFDRFYRVKEHSRRVPGTGLGLAIVKEIVEMHSGRIEVESEPGKGTTFTVSLPLNP